MATKSKTPLRRWLDAQKKPRPTVHELAALFECSVPTVYGLLSGDRTPSLQLATRIELMTGGGAKATGWGG